MGHSGMKRIKANEATLRAAEASLARGAELLRMRRVTSYKHGRLGNGGGVVCGHRIEWPGLRFKCVLLRMCNLEVFVYDSCKVVKL
jgi:hypothetical protein